MYKFLRSILFWFEPEQVHYFSMNWLKRFSGLPLGGRFFSGQFSISHPKLLTHAFGLTFKNPVGLAAGFDKNAGWLAELQQLGFGHVEIGGPAVQVTPLLARWLYGWLGDDAHIVVE